MTAMHRWLVITPEYESVVPLLEDGSGPTEIACNVVEVKAATRREALIKGVRELRKRKDGWMAEQKSNNANPFTGLKAYLADEAEQITDGQAEYEGQAQLRVALEVAAHLPNPDTTPTTMPVGQRSEQGDT